MGKSCPPLAGVRRVASPGRPAGAWPDSGVNVVIRARVTARLRCAWCHDAEGAGSGARCGACRTWLHTACWSEATQSCPTRGCPQQRRVVVAPHSRLRDLSIALLVPVILVAMAVAKFKAALGGPYGANTTQIDPDITAKINGGGSR